MKAILLQSVVACLLFDVYQASNPLKANLKLKDVIDRRDLEKENVKAEQKRRD